MWLPPVVLLYTGFFFGPFITLLTVMLTLRGRVPGRLAAFLTGVAGTAWCLLQGSSLAYGSLWDEITLQSVRSILNFSNGIVAYLAVRRVAAVTQSFRRSTAVWTVLYVLLMAALFFLLPNNLLVALGR